ncbi:MAG: FAD-binding dehydrogenase [Candidatus Nephrothrix sp. EaCA]|nr:MAG: FAD-binding dehydrogenase [Candidatus Nephrothrix sp. EaCA]
MKLEKEVYSRNFKQQILEADLVVAGGGLSGTCCAITAAREGLKVVLVQDRPVLGGNASSEVRLWVLGATSHMGNNNRWAREGGVINEILVENLYRNPEGNAVIFDTVVLCKTVSEKNITLLLNTAVIDIEKKEADVIGALKAFCSQNSTEYILKAPLFCDASGDGVVGFLSGAAFRMGAESKEEFGELFAPSSEYGELLGHSIYFYTKDTGKAVNYVPPSYALNDITKIPRYRKFSAKEQGCHLWWIEYGGRLDTVHDTETIKWELWKVVYGVWNYIKNSGKFQEAKNLTLEWVGTIPGKRESRRFEGDYILKQQDIVEQREHADAVAFGGWSVDLHPADGVFSERPSCNQWHSQGIFQIPYRCYYSRNIKNLFLAGRIISATHVAFASTRVMGTGAYGGQAVGMAATLCQEHHVLPRELHEKGLVHSLQQRLLKAGQHIPCQALRDPKNIVNEAKIETSSELMLGDMPDSGLLKPIDCSVSQLLPLQKGAVPEFVVHANSEVNTELDILLQKSSKPCNYTPDMTLAEKKIKIVPGRNSIKLSFDVRLEKPQYVFLVIKKNERVKLHYSAARISGILSTFNQINAAVSNYGKQTPPDNIGIDAFEFWCPQRRPEGHNLTMKIEPALKCFGADNLKNGVARPTHQPNVWAADWNDKTPSITLSWEQTKKIQSICLKFDSDFDHPMESVLMGHPENVVPFCVRNYSVFDGDNNLVHQAKDNYQTINRIKFEKPVVTKKLRIAVERPSPNVPAAIFEILCYEK